MGQIDDPEHDLFVLAEAERINEDRGRLSRAQEAAQRKAESFKGLADRIGPKERKRAFAGAVQNKARLRGKG